MPTPDPSPEAVAAWLKQLDRTWVHEQGWIAMNRRFNGITRAVRPFINQHFATDAERKAAFDGLTVALLAVGRQQDIEQLIQLFTQYSVNEMLTPQPTTTEETVAD